MADTAVQLTYCDALTTKTSGLWQAYTPDLSDEKAKELFEKKYGYSPKGQKRYASVLLVGPIFEESK